ncbi:sulfite exporter TauE/SafE family protein [Serpentinicella sp. ANB-PHB4]|uniref:sulfite exporter TauE/SafE family protein n=1 Tax=Serpentinicella sp. ANB-PHB4 TaxID=3074076 RepID=UPI00285E5C79|nr:sulfite exporter TauE/SafE family protein [Serpentinicella sp. ANB-PHB4]MDR5657866.1 sulfite exporter TauE/SafE family protein [Serpentinicella sp. ANB-PHB4]
MRNIRSWSKMIIIGFIAGLINGVFGAGGGIIVVPALTNFFDVPQHKAQATAISIILPFAILSSIVYYTKGFVDLPTTFKVAIGGIIGSYIGSKSLTKFSDNTLRKIFGTFMIIAAIRMVFS